MINTWGTCICQYQRRNQITKICNFQGLSPCHQQWPENPGAGKQTSLFIHSPCHSSCASYGHLIQSRTPGPIFHTLPLTTLVMCFCMWLCSSIAKASRKCFLCWEITPGSLFFSGFIGSSIFSSLVFTLLSDMEKLLFFRLISCRT